MAVFLTSPSGRGSRVSGRVRGAITLLLLVTGHWSLVTAQQAPATSVTLYQDGRILVRRAYPVRLPTGASTQKVALGPLDPTSVFALDSDVTITGATTTAAPDAESALRRMVGRDLVFRSGASLKDSVRATLVGMDPVRVRLADGSIYFGLPGTPTFPAEQATGESTTEIRVQSRRGSDQLRLGGFAAGGSWSATYAVILRGTSANVTGLASFATPLTADDAEVQLLAGQVNQATPTAGYRPMPMAARAMRDEESQKAAEQKVGEFHLYTLPGRQSLRPGTMSSIALFDPATAPVMKSYEVGASIPFSGYWGQTGDEGETPVGVFYTLTRARRTPFGDAPLPAGAARVFQADSSGRLQLVGEASLDHTAPGEDLRINAGTAFDLVVRRIQTSWTQGQEPVPGPSRRTRSYVIAAYADTLRNQGSEDALIEVPVHRGGDWQVLESSIPAERVSSTRARFKVKVPAEGQAVLTYRIKASW